MTSTGQPASHVRLPLTALLRLLDCDTHGVAGVPGFVAPSASLAAACTECAELAKRHFVDGSARREARGVHGSGQQA